MKQQLEHMVQQAIQKLIDDNSLAVTMPQIKIDRCRDKAHGDFAVNVAMLLAKPAKRNPREIAQLIIEAIGENPMLTKTAIAGPGFINFTINQSLQYNIIREIHKKTQQYGANNLGSLVDGKVIGQPKKIQIEFVSANPTGPLHVGHGRGAAYGATLANLLKVCGYQVDSEYYVNDAGRQMDILATSVWLRYLQANQIDISFPVNAYKGDYIADIAAQLSEDKKVNYLFTAEQVLKDLPADEDQGGDKELYIDAMISQAKTLLGQTSYSNIFDLAIQSILADIRDDLAGFGVEFDHWYSERSLVEKDLVNTGVQLLQDKGFIDNKDNTLWFRSTDFGDDKDRVVIRENGQSTYFASDIAYHMDKFNRGYDHVINIWGADHHGYIARVKASLTALGIDKDRLEILLVQFANLYRGGEKVQMSTRSGSFVTLRELRKEVGNDAARFFYVMRKCEQHMDFDLDLAKSQSSDNPVYYIQYAHARICSVIRQLDEKYPDWKSTDFDQADYIDNINLEVLNEEHELELIAHLGKYPETIASAGAKHEPHLIAFYLRELANALHAYYNKHHFIVEENSIRIARVMLILAVKQVLVNGLTILGVSAPEEM
ncbi:MAG: arginine--tRNA ligase [Pseudomonadota bacterium]